MAKITYNDATPANCPQVNEDWRIFVSGPIDAIALKNPKSKAADNPDTANTIPRCVSQLMCFFTS